MKLMHRMPPQTRTFVAARFDPARRRLLKTGVAGWWLLAASAALTSACARHEPGAVGAANAVKRAFFTPRDASIVRALAPVLLDGALPADAAGRAAALDDVVSAFDGIAAAMPPAVRAELRELFDLLGLGVTRALLAGVWSSWDQASAQEVAGFLDGWKTSRFNLFRSAYFALHDLIVAGWYGNEKSWARAGYPGPPKIT